MSTFILNVPKNLDTPATHGSCIPKVSAIVDLYKIMSCAKGESASLTKAKYLIDVNFGQDAVDIPARIYVEFLIAWMQAHNVCFSLHNQDD